MNNKILNEFRNFAIKGNAIDMAIGIIIGAAFTQIVNSLVNEIIMPPIGLMMGGVDFSDLSITLKRASETSEAVLLHYGIFINTLINFAIVAFAMFSVVKAMNTLKKKKEIKPTTKKCAECEMEIPIKAKKCGHCTSQLTT